jgi:zinc protease
VQLLQRRAGSAGAASRQLLREGLYGDHPLALPAEGSVASIEAVSYDDLRSLYRKAFAPENLIIAVVSPFGHVELKGMLPSLAGGGQPAAGLPRLPETTAPERLTASVGSPMGAVRMGSIRAIDPADRAALELLVAVLSERLQMDLRETRGLSYRVGAGIGVHGDQAVFTATINPPAARLAEGEEALAASLRDFDAGSITQDELDTARSARQGRLLMRRLDSISRAYYLAMAELDGDVRAYLSTIAAYDDVTLADLVRVASFFSELPLVTVVVD